MIFSFFVLEIEKFGMEFFAKMDKQVEIAIKKDWGNIELDKVRLMAEHVERRIEFTQKVELLKRKEVKATNWELVSTLINNMRNNNV